MFESIPIFDGKYLTYREYFGFGSLIVLSLVGLILIILSLISYKFIDKEQLR